MTLLTGPSGLSFSQCPAMDVLLVGGGWSDDLDDPEMFAVAHRLMRDWSGSADELASTAQSLSAHPRDASGTDA
jgi:hypothetical protein